MKYNPVGVGEIELNTIVLDLNGTLAVKGELVPGVSERIAKLKEMGFRIVLFSGDQRGNAGKITGDLGIELIKASTTEEKEKETLKLDTKRLVAIGNARIDIGTFKSAALRIGTLQAEGIHTGILPFVDILVPSINDALDLLLDENSFCATMRK